MKNTLTLRCIFYELGIGQNGKYYDTSNNTVSAELVTNDYLEEVGPSSTASELDICSEAGE